MTCDKCEYLKILYMPLRGKGIIWDFGRAKCTKHDLYVDFSNKGKFKKMKCVEEVKEVEE